MHKWPSVGGEGGVCRVRKNREKYLFKLFSGSRLKKKMLKEVSPIHWFDMKCDVDVLKTLLIAQGVTHKCKD